MGNQILPSNVILKNIEWPTTQILRYTQMEFLAKLKQILS